MAHELGHTVGLWHEHSNPNRSQYIDIIWDNVLEGEGYKLQFGIERYFERESGVICDFPRSIGPYDYCSIMHYESHAFAKMSNLITIKTLRPVKDATI
jgi:hypothetical protein